MAAFEAGPGADEGDEVGCVHGDHLLLGELGAEGVAALRTAAGPKS
ncbi:hypothetical protein [Streptomyces jumonjinensis]|nr:hypothetical protein [Streptomyces jumonjinensis]